MDGVDLYMAAIVLHGVIKSFGERKVLDRIDLSIERGRFTSLLGDSGSGKTTILRLIAGLEYPDAGEIFIDNRLASEGNRVSIPPRDRGVGFIFQDLALWPHLTAFENIAFGLRVQGTKYVKKKVMEMANLLGLNERLLDNYPDELSGGQQQLVAIARSLIVKPSILLMDEPFSSLDVHLKQRMYDMLKSLLNDLSITVVYVTHDHEEACYLSDEIFYLEEGRISGKRVC